MKKSVYQPHKPHTRYKYTVCRGHMTLENYDFILDSKRFFYYQPQVSSLHIDRSWLVYERWMNQARDHDPAFGWDQLCKLPYLYQSLSHEQCMRFPLAMTDGGIITCGTGRAIVIDQFYPNINIDAFVVSRQPRLDLTHRLFSVKDLEAVLLNRPFFQDRGQSFRLSYQIDDDDLIMATDFRRDRQNYFPFCEDSVDHAMMTRIRTILDQGWDTRTSIRAICQISMIDQ